MVIRKRKGARKIITKIEQWGQSGNKSGKKRDYKGQQGVKYVENEIYHCDEFAHSTGRA